MNKNLKALANGKELVDSDNNILHIEQVILATANTDDVGTGYTLEELDELEIYVNPLQTKIDEMQAAIDRLTADLVAAHTPNIKTAYNHLTKAEVKEIEDIFMEKPNMNRELICSTYSSSQPVISRVARGVHTKTSESYKTYLMKKEL